MSNRTESEKWKLIKELEDTIQARWQRLNELGRLGKELGLHVENLDKRVIYEGWAKLTDMYERGLWNGNSSSKK